MRKLYVLLMVIIVFSNCSYQEREYSEDIVFTVLFFNDLHGTLLPYEEMEDGIIGEYGGISHISRKINDIREENQKKGQKTFVLFAGDLLQGSLFSTIFRGYPDILCFNEMNIDAMVIGNHEFDFGIDNFLHLKESADFPVISSNIYYNEELISEPYTLIPVHDGIYLTVIGSTIEDIFNVIDRSLLEGITTMNPINAIDKYVHEFTGQGPVIILSHDELETEKEIAGSFPDITAIITGHDHILLDPPIDINGVKIFQGYQKGKYLGRMDIVYDIYSGSSSIIDYQYYLITSNIPRDSNIEDILRGYREMLDARFSEAIGYTEVFLDADRNRIRNQETNLGNFVADSVRQYFDLDIVFINAGAVRSSISQGDISLGDIYNSLTFENDIYTLELTGKEIMDILELSFGINFNYGGFLIQSGLRIELKDREIKRVSVLSHNEEPIDLSKTYTIGINNFMAGGGDNYEIFQDKPKTRQYISFRNLVINTIINKKSINPEIDGRIVFE